MQGQMKVKGKRTPDLMAEKAKELLNIGQKVKIIRYVREKIGGEITKVKKVGTVVEKSNHVFLVDFGKYKEAFRYGQLFCLEEERVVL